MKNKITLLFTLMLIFPNIVFAAKIEGIVYDLSLDLVEGARIWVNTTPQQNIIAKNGRYSIEIPKGFYSIDAELYEDNILISSENRNITIKDDGNYVIDLILFPNFDEEIISDAPELNLPDTDDNNKIMIILGLLVFVIVFTAVYYYVSKQNKKKQKGIKGEFIVKDEAKKKTYIDEEKSDEEKSKDEHYISEKGKKSAKEDEDLEKVINIIKQEGNRTTQKEIRKYIPLSEAKISLLIAELEHKGIIEKIKKGRGNIIILKKDETQKD